TGVAYGVFQGRTTIFVAQMYANPIVPTTTQSQVVVQEETTPTRSVAQDIPDVTEEETTIAILGAETETLNEAPKSNEPEKKVVIAETNELEEKTVVAATTALSPSPSMWQKALASPRNTMNMILFTVLSIMMVALLLNAVIKIKHHHLDLVTNGLVAVAIIGAIFVGNYYESHRNMVITQSWDYSNEIAY
ncbi:MAG: hypothetical protein WD963_02560, partial [Candidatus Paceibacterota bacterium]